MVTDLDYDNGAAVAGSERYGAIWTKAAAAFRDALGSRARLGLPYGPAPRERADLFLPECSTEGLVIYIHGGYWRSRDRDDWSHFAEGSLARGQAVAMPSYTLAPQITLTTMAERLAAAVEMLAGEVPDVPIRLVGHSAGGHMVARLIAEGSALPDVVLARITHVMSISPISDLTPLLGLALNDDLRLTPEEAQAESPLFLNKRSKTLVSVWVGADELPAFVDQARWLAGAWDAPLHEVAGRHHFDIIDALRDAESDMVRTLLD
ncbi:alpha/beta hydrolase [Palleronia caenipelagi]|uniref:Alpha/beta hydrolase n=1 Tax=Palleronia caenipelagi TaxID=2489174 RepID=A0A547Q2J7_9RHOB|nr:alpha/beta hydrolase [Palleronia caenipelagi]TRD20605.1 alpha/beta hydrolase [Palleronia caenipelagi]